MSFCLPPTRQRNSFSPHSERSRHRSRTPDADTKSKRRSRDTEKNDHNVSDLFGLYFVCDCLTNQYLLIKCLYRFRAAKTRRAIRTWLLMWLTRCAFIAFNALIASPLHCSSLLFIPFIAVHSTAANLHKRLIEAEVCQNSYACLT